MVWVGLVEVGGLLVGVVIGVEGVEYDGVGGVGLCG